MGWRIEHPPFEELEQSRRPRRQETLGTPVPSAVMDNVMANLGEVGQPVRESNALDGRAAWPFRRGTANVDGDFMGRDEALLHDPRPRIRGRDGLHISVRSLMLLRGKVREGIGSLI